MQWSPFFVMLRLNLCGDGYTMGSIYGLSVGIIGFIFFFSALTKLKASTTALLCYLEVLSTIVCGILFFKEQLSPNMMLGASLILGGSFFLKKSQ